jgi:hypothetical protein
MISLPQHEFLSSLSRLFLFGLNENTTPFTATVAVRDLTIKRLPQTVTAKTVLRIDQEGP